MSDQKSEEINKAGRKLSRARAPVESPGGVPGVSPGATPGIFPVHVLEVSPGKFSNGGLSKETISTALKVPKIIATLAEAITDDDLDKVAGVYRDALTAETWMWDHELKKQVMRPDHKTRIAAANMIAAYREGLPVQRQVTLTQSFDGAEDALARFKNSPAAIEAFGSIEALEDALEPKEKDV